VECVSFTRGCRLASTPGAPEPGCAGGGTLAFRARCCAGAVGWDGARIPGTGRNRRGAGKSPAESGRPAPSLELEVARAWLGEEVDTCSEPGAVQSTCVPQYLCSDNPFFFFISTGPFCLLLTYWMVSLALAAIPQMASPTQAGIRC